MLECQQAVSHQYHLHHPASLRTRSQELTQVIHLSPFLDHVSTTTYLTCYAGMRRPCYLSDFNSDSRVGKFRTPDTDSGTKILGLQLQLQAQNRTLKPTLGYFV